MVNSDPCSTVSATKKHQGLHRIRFSNWRRIVVFRIYFSFVGLIYNIALFQLRHVRFGVSWLNSPWLELLHFCWFVLLLLMLLGRGGWVRNVLHFAVTLVLLDPLIALPVGNSVQEALYLLLAFSLIFIDVDERQEAKASEWSELGIWLFGMNFGFILISAGLFKAMCPLWAAGDGFGITYNLPWIREPALNVGETLLLLMSYGSILLEVGFLIAFLLPALRWVSLIMLCCFFGGLIFPLRLDMIGWIGMGYPILLLSITQLPFCTHPASGHRSPRVRAVAAAGFLYCCLLCTSQFFTRWDFTENDYERLYGDSVGATADNDAFRDGIVYRGVRKLNELLTPMIGANSVQQFNRYCTRQKPWTLFTKRHLIGICEFRVVVTTALGEELHPFNLFNVDLTPGPGTTGLFVCRNLQSQMYALSDLYHRASYAGEDVAELMKGTSPRVYESLIRFALSRCSSRALQSATVLVRPIIVDLKKYKLGVSVADPKDFDWQPLVSFDIKSQEFSLSKTKPVPIQARVEGLPNFWVTQNPRTN